MKPLKMAATLAGTLLMAGQLQANVTVNPVGSDGAGTGLQTELNSRVTPAAGDTWNPGTLSGSDYINGTVQNNQSPLTALWTLTGAGSSATIVLEIAGNAGANTFGFYDPSSPGTTQAQLFNGPAAAGSKVYLKFSGNQLQSSLDNLIWANVAKGGFSSTTFGMYLSGPGGTFFSDGAGSQNLVAYQGFDGRTITIGANPEAWDANSYVIGWEDLPLSQSDLDYQDMVLLVSEVVPVPEPTTIIAGALLLLPLGASTLRVLRRNRAA